MALLRRGDMSVTEICFAVGCSSLGTFSTRFTELVGAPPSTYRRGGQRRRHDAGVQRVTDQQNGEALAPSRAEDGRHEQHHHSREHAAAPQSGRVPASIATPWASASAATSSTRMHWITVGLDQPGTSIVLYPPKLFGIHRRRRRTIAEMMAKGTFASINLATSDSTARSRGCRPGDAEVVQEPTDQPYGIRDCAFRDPAGNLIRIQELTNG